MTPESPQPSQYAPKMVGLSFKVSPTEKKNLEDYCERLHISQTEVIRRFLRELSDTNKKG